MAFIGKIIKGAIDVTGFINSDPKPERSQHRVLLELLEKAKHTAFGKKYRFSTILASSDPVRLFQREVPVHDYDQMYASWWHYLREGHQNITWPGGQRYFALSSGTTTRSKTIPVTDDMLEAIKKAGIQQIMSLKNFDLPSDFFEKQIMMLGSSTALTPYDDFLEGEISGISAANIPIWFRGFYRPGAKIAATAHWDERVRQIAEAAPKWDIGSMTGIPSWSELLLKEIIRYNGADTIHDIWPNLQVYTSGGVAFEPYRKSFDKLLSRPITYIDTYLASEGYLATQKRPDTTAMSLITDNGIFFEFVHFKDDNIDDQGRIRQGAEVLTLENAEIDTEYILLISTVAGAWRYMIGDTVKITDKEKAEIVITGRTKHFLNVVGEQLSVHQMNTAMQYLEHEFDLEIQEFTVAAIRQGETYINKWYIGTDKEAKASTLAECLDNQLAYLNKNYKVARHKALRGVEVEVVPTAHFYRWSEAFKKMGGQTKIPRVMQEDDFRDFEKYIATL